MLNPNDVITQHGIGRSVGKDFSIPYDIDGHLTAEGSIKAGDVCTLGSSNTKIRKTVRKETGNPIIPKSLNINSTYLSAVRAPSNYRPGLGGSYLNTGKNVNRLRSIKMNEDTIVNLYLRDEDLWGQVVKTTDGKLTYNTPIKLFSAYSSIDPTTKGFTDAATYDDFLYGYNIFMDAILLSNGRIGVGIIVSQANIYMTNTSTGAKIVPTQRVYGLVITLNSSGNLTISVSSALAISEFNFGTVQTLSAVSNHNGTTNFVVPTLNKIGTASNGSSSYLIPFVLNNQFTNQSLSFVTMQDVTVIESSEKDGSFLVFVSQGMQNKSFAETLQESYKHRVYKFNAGAGHLGSDYFSGARGLALNTGFILDALRVSDGEFVLSGGLPTQKLSLTYLTQNVSLNSVTKLQSLATRSVGLTMDSNVVGALMKGRTEKEAVVITTSNVNEVQTLYYSIVDFSNVNPSLVKDNTVLPGFSTTTTFVKVFAKKVSNDYYVVSAVDASFRVYTCVYKISASGVMYTGEQGSVYVLSTNLRATNPVQSTATIYSYNYNSFPEFGSRSSKEFDVYYDFDMLDGRLTVQGYVGDNNFYIEQFNIDDSVNLTRAGQTVIPIDPKFVALTTSEDGNPVKYISKGLTGEIYENLTPGSRYYLTKTGSLTKEKTEFFLGYAISDKEILVKNSLLEGRG